MKNSEIPAVMRKVLLLGFRGFIDTMYFNFLGAFSIVVFIIFFVMKVT
ncbi:MAG: hypothetical protein K6G84_07945 [Lachnospiraceae bacterium]|nr:hypothetical protein [Lachnospiraceae bacterium]